MIRNAAPVLTVLLAMVVLWYLAAVWMNSTWTLAQAERAGTTPGFSEIVRDTMAQNRPKLPAPHQVATELWSTTVEKKVTSKRSLVFHGWITLRATLMGFALGTFLGISLAIGIVYSRVMELSVMPWAVISQTIPIVALAPMIIGLGEGGRLRAPMAIAVIGGLISSTLLTLIVIPSLYEAFERLRRRRPEAA